jgi:hypothetical protein
MVAVADICVDPIDRGAGPIGYQSKVRVIDRYKVIGFISSGTYGRVYKAVGRHGQPGEFAIKKFKPGKSGYIQYIYMYVLVLMKLQTRRVSKSNIQEFRSLQFGKWLSAQNLVT